MVFHRIIQLKALLDHYVERENDRQWEADDRAREAAGEVIEPKLYPKKFEPIDYESHGRRARFSSPRDKLLIGWTVGVAVTTAFGVGFAVHARRRLGYRGFALLERVSHPLWKVFLTTSAVCPLAVVLLF